MLAENDAELRARAVNQILTIRMKAQDPTQVPPEVEEDGRGVDEIDDDHEAEDDVEDGGLQMDDSEKAAIASSQVCKYVIPKINFDALDYPDMIDWETSQLSEPPLTSNLTNDQLIDIQDSPDYPGG